MIPISPAPPFLHLRREVNICIASVSGHLNEKRRKEAVLGRDDHALNTPGGEACLSSLCSLCPDPPVPIQWWNTQRKIYELQGHLTSTIAEGTLMISISHELKEHTACSPCHYFNQAPVNTNLDDNGCWRHTLAPWEGSPA